MDEADTDLALHLNGARVTINGSCEGSGTGTVFGVLGPHYLALSPQRVPAMALLLPEPLPFRVKVLMLKVGRVHT